MSMKKILSTLAILLSFVAVVSAQTAEVFKSDGISAETQEQYEDAAKAFDAAAKAFREQQITDTVSIYRAGVNYVRIKQYEKALPFLQESAELNYNTGRTLRLLADAWEGLKDAAKAEAVLLEGKEKYPDDAFEFEKKLAYLYFNTGQYENAAASFELVNAASPGNKNYLYLYGFSLERLKKYDQAIAQFEQVLQLFPGDKRSKKMLGITLFEKTDELNEKEVKRYEGMKNAKLEDYITTKKRLENINEGYEKARVILEESLEDFPNDKQVINSLYLLYKKQFKEDKAAQMKARL